MTGDISQVITGLAGSIIYSFYHVPFVKQNSIDDKQRGRGDIYNWFCYSYGEQKSMSSIIFLWHCVKIGGEGYLFSFEGVRFFVSILILKNRLNNKRQLGGLL